MRIDYIKKAETCMGGICKSTEIYAITRLDSFLCKRHGKVIFDYLSIHEFKRFLVIEGVEL